MIEETSEVMGDPSPHPEGNPERNDTMTTYQQYAKEIKETHELQERSNPLDQNFDDIEDTEGQLHLADEKNE